MSKRPNPYDPDPGGPEPVCLLCGGSHVGPDGFPCPACRQSGPSENGNGEYCEFCGAHIAVDEPHRRSCRENAGKPWDPEFDIDPVVPYDKSNLK